MLDLRTKLKLDRMEKEIAAHKQELHDAANEIFGFRLKLDELEARIKVLESPPISPQAD